MKFKSGDKVVILKKPGAWMQELPQYSVQMVHRYNVVSPTKVYINDTRNMYVEHELMSEEIFFSPLYQALEEH